MTNYSNGIVQAQHAGDVRRSDLSQRVADHRIRLDPPRTPQSRQTDLNRKQSRLDEIDFVQPRLGGIGGRELGEQRPVAVRPHRLVAAFDDLTKNGFLLQQSPPHAEPLTALPREYEDKFSSLCGKLAARRQAGTGLAPQKRVEALDQLRRRIAGRGKTVIVVSQPRARRVTDVAQCRLRCGSGKKILVGAGERLKRFRTARR